MVLLVDRSSDKQAQNIEQEMSLGLKHGLFQMEINTLCRSDLDGKNCLSAQALL
jgi:hypothetical protein